MPVWNGVRSGIISHRERLQGIPVSLIERWIPYFNRKECVIIQNVNQLGDTNTAEYRLLREHAITSLVAAPLEKGGTLLGCLVVDNPPAGRLSVLRHSCRPCAIFCCLRAVMRRARRSFRG